MSRRKKGYLILISGTLIALAYLILWLDQRMIGDIMLFAATIVAGYPIAKNAIHALLLKVIGIELLVTFAVVGALFIGEYIESAVVTFLFLFGSYLEARTLEKTRTSIKSLLDMTPLEARVLQNGEKVMIPAEEVQRKSIVYIHSGEKVPVDGRVIRGDAYVMEAAITGESLPTPKGENDPVYSGTIVDHGYLEVEAEHVGEDTTFAKILQLVEEAQERKAKTQKFLDRFASYYTPGIVVISLLLYLFTKDIRLTLTFLVISCPGALVISAPVSIVAGIGNGAKNGVLIKGGEIMERTAKLDVIAFDKTGTLTIGRPQVVHVQSFVGSEEELLKRAAELEQYSEHHLGRAIMQEAHDRGLIVETIPTDYEVRKGKGVRAKLKGRSFVAGNKKLIQELGIVISQEMEERIIGEENLARTAVIIADENEILGILSIADQIRPEAAQTISTLKARGFKKVIMLTGDNSRVASAVAKQIGVDEAYAELLPEQKVAKLTELQEQGLRVAMVGDGINDAPAIATAEIGIAMGSAGTDVAMETADILLMGDRIEKLPYAIQLARTTVNNMKQNMFFAVSVVLLLLIGVLTKKVFLASGMLIHELSVLFVILNAIRLVKYRVKQKQTKAALFKLDGESSF